MKKLTLILVFLILSTNVTLSQTVLLNNYKIDSTSISSNLETEVYNSGPITTNPYEGLEISIKYTNQLPAFIDGLPSPFHNIHLIVEKEITPGNWITFLSQLNKFVKEENDNTYEFQHDPSVINFDEGVPQYLGNGILSYKIRGRLPNEIRFRILITDYKYNQIGEFESISIFLSYDLYNL